MNLFQIQGQIARIEAEKAKQRDIIRRAQMKLRELERKKKTLLNRIGRLIDRTGRIGRGNLPENAAREVERDINREGWMERIIDQRFKRQAARATGSPKWAKLRPSTIKDRLRKGFGRGPILVRTGDLYRGAHEAVAGSFNLRRGIQWDVADVDVDYAIYHQEGTSRMPARRFFDSPSNKELEPTMKRVRQLIREKLRKLARSA